MIVETTTFQLLDGVTDAEFLEVDERVRTQFLYGKRGLVRATTARGDDGEWITVVLWASARDADDAAATAADDEQSSRKGALVEAATVDRRRYTTFE